MPPFADLHCHSNVSDGIFGPAEVVRVAARAGLHALALTDHDAISGIPEALEAAAEQGIELVPGVEISAADEPQKDRFGLHILGLFLDHENKTLAAFMDAQREGRIQAKLEQIERFRNLGLVVDSEALFAQAEGVPGKPHLVAALLRDNPDAGLSERILYQEYFAHGGPAYVVRQDEPPAEACIEIIHDAGGVALLAHPLFYRTQDLPALVAGLPTLDGIEIDMPYEINEDFQEVLGGRAEILKPLHELALRRGCLISGGSDFHGDHKGGSMGAAGVDEGALELLRTQAQRVAAYRG